MQNGVLLCSLIACALGRAIVSALKVNPIIHPFANLPRLSFLSRAEYRLRVSDAPINCASYWTVEARVTSALRT